MEKLSQQKCEACQVGAPKVTDEELEELMEQIPQWQVPVRDNIMMLEREFKFKNFKLAMEFSNAVGDIAEEVNHHPSILTEWGKVTITWWTHKIKGLHKTDFIMAARTDELFDK